MAGPNAAESLDLVALAVANALEDERPVTAEEIAALREAKADPRPMISGAEATASIAKRAAEEE